MKSEKDYTDEQKLRQKLINKSEVEEDIIKRSLKSQVKTRETLLNQDKNEKEDRRQAKNSTRTLRRLFGYTFRNKCLLLIANLAMLVSSAGTTALPFLVGRMVDTIRSGTDLQENGIQFLILTAAMAVFSCIRGYCFCMLGQKVMVNMRQQLFDKLLAKDISYYDKNKTGELLSRLGNDISTIYSVCSDNLSVLFRSIIQFIGSLVLVWLISWKLTVVTLIITLSSLGIIFLFKYTKKYQKQYSNNLAYTTSLASEVFSNIRVVRSFSNEELELKNYYALLNKVFLVGRKKHLLYGLIVFATTTFGNILILTILYQGGQLVIEGQMTIGDLTSFVLYTISITMGFSSITGILSQTISAMGIAENIFEIIDQPIEIVPGLEAPDFSNQQGPLIEFVNATFKYPSKPTVQVLKGINLHIRSGESVAIVGPSGSGKSSIVSLILRFYDLNDGELKINGRNIKQLNNIEMRQKIGFVSQEPTLFSGSLRENVEYGIRQVADKEKVVMDALAVANAKQFVMNAELFPEGLETIVGERGVKLSGGQKQRIAIARCIAKDPKILIFDEATSALDAESEYQVQQAIDNLVGKRDRTMIIVAHRLSTIINCDRIIVIKSGEIAEQGTHQQLLASRGIYASLVQRQLSK